MAMSKCGSSSPSSGIRSVACSSAAMTPSSHVCALLSHQSGRVSDTSKAIDSFLVFRAEVGIDHAETLALGKTQDADLALMQVAVHVVGGLAGLGQWVDPGQRRVH